MPLMANVPRLCFGRHQLTPEDVQAGILRVPPGQGGDPKGGQGPSEVAPPGDQFGQDVRRFPVVEKGDLQRIGQLGTDSGE